jgi:hypothetical protein
VGFLSGDLAAIAAHGRFGVDEVHDLVSLSDELSGLEDLEVQILRQDAKPRHHRFLAPMRAGRGNHVGGPRVHPLDVVGQ